MGRWLFEPTLNRLRDDDVVVELEPIASRLLEVLCSSPGEVFSADELVTRVWGDRIVSDNPIYKAMANLRKSLGE
ncbi:MAG: winged helix-turn-helix domain-containing protein, partial [Pseudomonadota bacterium]